MPNSISDPNSNTCFFLPKVANYELHHEHFLYYYVLNEKRNSLVEGHQMSTINIGVGRGGGSVSLGTIKQALGVDTSCHLQT